MQQLIIMLHVLICVSLVALVLMQHGKGADVGAAFGSGASNTMFGSQGSTPFLVKVTGLLAAGFFLTSLSLTYLVSQRVEGVGGFQQGIGQMNLPTMPAPASPKKQQTPN